MLFWEGELPGNKIKILESFVFYNHVKGGLHSGWNRVSGRFACRNTKEAMFLSGTQKAGCF